MQNRFAGGRFTANWFPVNGFKISWFGMNRLI